MNIEINTDNHISNSARFTEELSQSLHSSLGKFESHLSRIEVYLSDANKNKGGSDDKKCTIEARIEGMKPLAATHKAATLREAFSGASRKIERVVRDSLDRRRAA